MAVASTEFRSLLLAGASALALAASTPSAGATDARPPYGNYVTLEGGYACPFGEALRLESGVQIGSAFPPLAAAQLHGDCGASGRIGLSQWRPGLLGGLADHWGLFWREQRSTGRAGAVGALDETGSYRNAFSSRMQEARSVVDFEIGKDLGVGATPDSVRIVGGLRYARFERDTKLAGVYTDVIFPNLPYFFDARLRTAFHGAGPRIGLSSRLPLAGEAVSLRLAGFAAAIYGERTTRIDAVHADGAVGGPAFDAARVTERGLAINFEGEAALAVRLFRGADLQVGARADAWFSRATSAGAGATCNAAPSLDAGGCTRMVGRERQDVTPFLRLDIKLD